MTTMMTVGEYFATRLQEVGVHSVFGVPGDFILGLCDTLSRKLCWVGCTNELNAGYAADGYARINGAGCVVTTFGVGELSSTNAVAGAFAERIPLVLVAGAPPRTARVQQLPLHHTLGDYDLPRKALKRVTAAAELIETANDAPRIIDRVLETCICTRRPVYICLPTDIVGEPVSQPTAPLQTTRVATAVDADALGEATSEAAAMLNVAHSPIVLADVGIIRAGAKEAFMRLIDTTGLPFVTMLMAKGVISDESHPLFAGVYHGRRSRKEVWTRVESADCVLQLGLFISDKNTGGFSMRLTKANVINANDDKDSVNVRNHVFPNVPLRTFIEALTPLLHKRIVAAVPFIPKTAFADFSSLHPAPNAALNAQLTTSFLFRALASRLPPRCILVADAGVSSFCLSELLLPSGASFILQAFYVSIGFSLPAALGASVAAPDRKVVLVIGDGSFQMVATELGSFVRQRRVGNGSDVVVILLNNDGYTVERLIHDGPFNDLARWQYHKLPEALGAPNAGLLARTEEDFVRSLDVAFAQQQHADTAANKLTFIEAQLARDDAPQSLHMAAADMRGKH